MYTILVIAICVPGFFFLPALLKGKGRGMLVRTMPRRVGIIVMDIIAGAYCYRYGKEIPDGIISLGDALYVCIYIYMLAIGIGLLGIILQGSAIYKCNLFRWITLGNPKYQ